MGLSACKSDKIPIIFFEAIDITDNGCYSTNRTKSVEEDAVDAVSSINMQET